MKTTLLFVRHGQSEANLNSIFAGRTSDFPLTELGYKQAGIMAEFVKKNYKIDAIYSSSLSRAIKKAEPIADNLNLEINRDGRLNEIDGGIWNGMKYDDISIKYKDEFELWKTRGGRPQTAHG